MTALTARLSRAAVMLLALAAGALLLGCGSRAETPAAAAAAERPRIESTPGAAQAASTPAVTTNSPPTRAERGAFLVALDPGHGGDESGAAAYGVVERDSNLDMAQRVGEYLKAAGVQVHMTRLDNRRATGLKTDPGDTRPSTRNDLQERSSAANRAGADIFVSLHSNGSGDPNMRGFEVYYESRRPFADDNYRLAKELLNSALQGAANAGHPSPNRGVIDAACWRNFGGRCVGLFVLSPEGSPTSGSAQNGTPARAKEATNMPAALLESLFVSSPDDAAMLKNDAVRASIARGIADGILRYLGVATA